MRGNRVEIIDESPSLPPLSLSLRKKIKLCCCCSIRITVMTYNVVVKDKNIRKKINV
ncbi:hypothetical protein OAV88_00985 [bacterium]|nr:hypothetical protein [bacterium]